MLMIGITKPRLFNVESAPCGVIVRGVASLYYHSFTSFSLLCQLDGLHWHIACRALRMKTRPGYIVVL